jgi:hypothetical protein
VECREWVMWHEGSISIGIDSTSVIRVGEKNICMMKTPDVWILNVGVNDDQNMDSLGLNMGR